MRNRIWFVAAMAALLLTLAYRIQFTDDPLTMETWYRGQDITEGDEPMPFAAEQTARAAFPERDEAGDLPSDVYRDYLAAAAAGVFDTSRSTRDSQAFFRGRRVSAQQLANSVAGESACRGGEELATYDRAVLRYPPDLRLCPPLLFRRESGRWRLDFIGMHDAIGHNQRNQWHFLAGQPPAEYAFAFNGWRFDSNGYPRIP